MWESSKTYWTPPALFTEPAPPLTDLAAYAKTGPWTHQPSGLLRKAGVFYYRFAGYPITVVLRYGEWVTQRPGRLLLHLGLAKLFALTGPGEFLIDHIVYPAATHVGQIIL